MAVSSQPIIRLPKISTRAPLIPTPKSQDQTIIYLFSALKPAATTAAAIVRSRGEILSQVVSSQVVQETLDKANVSETDVSAVAVIIGPSLSLCLHVGVRKARKAAGSFNLPIIGVHHMEAHALVARF